MQANNRRLYRLARGIPRNDGEAEDYHKAVDGALETTLLPYATNAYEGDADGSAVGLATPPTSRFKSAPEFFGVQLVHDTYRGQR